MDKFVGAFGRVSEVKAVKSQGVTRITIEVPVEHHKLATSSFFDAEVILTLGKRNGAYGVFTSDSIDEPEPVKEKGYGHYYQPLFSLGSFNNPKLWPLFGTDTEYQDYVRTQPSCVSGKFDYDPITGEGRSIYAHVRRAANAGTAYKPDYFGVPMTNEEHELQHQKGESAHKGGKDFFDKKAAFYRSEWMKSIIYKEFGIESLTELEPEKFLHFAKERGFIDELPSDMRKQEGQNK